MTGVLMQVRLGSTRLPAKALLPLADRTVVEHAMIALRKVDADLFTLVTDEQSAPGLAPAAVRCGYELFVGDAENVLRRYIDAATRHNVTTIIRATGDNPVVSGSLAAEALRFHREQHADLTRFEGLPIGCGVEVVERSALEQAVAEGTDRYDEEHVTAHLYRHAAGFRVQRIDAPQRFCCPDCRVTLDTENDYQRLQQLFAERYRGEPMEVEEIIQWCNRETERAVCP